MNQDATVRAAIAGLRWAADALEDGRIEILYISHKRELQKDAIGAITDDGQREFTLVYLHKGTGPFSMSVM
jgi:hypothetical protein